MTGTAIATGIVATSGLAISLGAAVIAEGYIINQAAKESDNRAVREIGEIVGGSLVDGGTGGIIGGAMKGKQVAKLVKNKK